MACRTLFGPCLTGKLLACDVAACEHASTRPQGAHPLMHLHCIHHAQGACSSYEVVALTGSASQAAPLAECMHKRCKRKVQSELCAILCMPWSP